MRFPHPQIKDLLFDLKRKKEGTYVQFSALSHAARKTEWSELLLTREPLNTGFFVPQNDSKDGRARPKSPRRARHP